MNDEYTENAYQCAIIKELLRHLIDNYIPVANLDPKDQLVCEEVPYKLRVVPIDSLVSMVSLLREREQWLRTEMDKFEMRRTTHVPLKPKDSETAQEKPKASEKKPAKAREKNSQKATAKKEPKQKKPGRAAVQA